MLEQEMWRRLPTPAGRQPNFKAALEGKGESQAAQAFDTSSFSSWVAAGNPWKRQESGESLLLSHVATWTLAEHCSSSEISLPLRPSWVFNTSFCGQFHLGKMQQLYMRIWNSILQMSFAANFPQQRRQPKYLVRYPSAFVISAFHNYLWSAGTVTPSEEPASESGETSEEANGSAEPSRPEPRFHDPLLNGSSAAKGTSVEYSGQLTLNLQLSQALLSQDISNTCFPSGYRQSNCLDGMNANAPSLFKHKQCRCDCYCGHSSLSHTSRPQQRPANASWTQRPKLLDNVSGRHLDKLAM